MKRSRNSEESECDGHRPHNHALRTSASTKPEDHGLNPEQACILSSRLQCDVKDVVAETLGYVLGCRVSRGCLLNKEDIVELWDSLQDCHKTRDPASSNGRFLILGANPRYPQAVTVATTQLPHFTRSLCNFVKQQSPNYTFTTVSIRLNCDKPPHRDTRNGAGLSFIQLLEQVEGGEVWVADPMGTVHMEVHGQQIAGTLMSCFPEPLLLDARRKLHATAPWTGARRLLLTAWSVINVAQHEGLCKLLCRSYGFPLEASSPSRSMIQQSLQASFRRSVQNTTNSSLMLQGNNVIQDLEAETVDDEDRDITCH